MSRMGRKFVICCRRRLLLYRFIYYLLLVLFAFIVVRLVKNYLRVQNSALESNSANELNHLLKVDSTSKLCQKSKAIDVYEVCYETNVGKIPTNNVILISAEYKNTKLEEEIPYELDEVNVTQLLDNSQSYFRLFLKLLIQVPVLGCSIWLHSLTRSIEHALNSHTNSYNLLKIGSLPTNQQPYKISFIKKLITDGILQEFNQLYLLIDNNVEIDRRKEWEEIVQLLKKENYQLFSVHRVDACSDPTCSFATSWLRIDQAMKNLDEEINPLDTNFDFGAKLHSLLKIRSSSCRRKVIVPSSVDKASVVEAPTASRWPVCLDDIEPPCMIYSAKIGGSELFESIMARLGCEVYLFDPTLNLTNTPKKQSTVMQNIKKFNWTLGASNSKLVSGFVQPEMYEFVKASEVLQKLGHEQQLVNILRLDLHGGEWDVLDSIINAKQHINYQQLLLTMHVWHGEDKFNLLDRLIRLKRIFGAHFRIFHSEAIGPPEKKPQADGTSCCYVIGLLNTNFNS